MPSQLTTVGGVTLGFVVKKVKGRLYVYEQYRVGGKVITKYVAPLEVLVRYYQMRVVNNDASVNYKLTSRILRRLTEALAKAVVNSLKNKKLVGPPPGLEPGTSGSTAPRSAI